MKIKPEDLFVDELDGRLTLGLNMGEKDGTISIGNFEEDDSWFYPSDLTASKIGIDDIENVINVFLGENEKWVFNVYDLPKNWKDIVTYDGGQDGKPSIHDIMIEVS